jgi:hypothetical protein
VEAAIEWKSFHKARNVPPLGMRWRLNFYAMKHNSGVSWSPILGQGNFHKANRFGYVVFVPTAPTPKASAPGAIKPPVPKK